MVAILSTIAPHFGRKTAFFLKTIVTDLNITYFWHKLAVF
jgi:hypothetical protein